MEKRLTKEELIRSILEDKNIDIDEYEDVIHLLIDKTISKDINYIHKETYKLGDRISDRLAEFVGSWTFIILFLLCLIVWILINLFIMTQPFDPFPFILLNLILSCIAATQAPLIMMSQNRQEKKDRLRAKNDYKVNLKSELIVEDLHKKLDELLKNQKKMFEKFDTLNND